MSGTIPLSMTQQFNVLGEPLNGGQLYIIQVGTVSTPQNAYQDTALTTALPYPITLDAAGRVPQFFLADGFVKIRLQDRNGVVQVAADSVMVIGASSGGGGGGSTVDPTTLIQTGMMALFYGTGSVVGFARANGRTIGSFTSGATERANADTQALFLFLWAADANLVLIPPRGASAAADWAANKQITLPDWRGCSIGGLDDMGNTAAGRLTATYFGTAATVLGAFGGAESKTIVAANLPPYTPAGTIAGTVTGTVQGTVNANQTGATAPFSDIIAGGTLPITATFSGSFTGTPAVGQTSTPFSNMQPTRLCTIHLKL